MNISQDALDSISTRVDFGVTTSSLASVTASPACITTSVSSSTSAARYNASSAGSCNSASSVAGSRESASSEAGSLAGGTASSAACIMASAFSIRNAARANILGLPPGSKITPSTTTKKFLPQEYWESGDDSDDEVIDHANDHDGTYHAPNSSDEEKSEEELLADNYSKEDD